MPLCADAAELSHAEGEDKPNKKFYDPRVWIRKSEESAVYKSMFMTKEDREREAEKDAKNYAARGIPMNLNWL